MFNSKERKELSKKRKEEVEQSAKTEVIRYLKECQKKYILPNVFDIDAIWDETVLTTRQMISELFHDNDRLEYYTNLCLIIWRYITNTKVYSEQICNGAQKQRLKLNLKRHVISILYKLKSGYQIHDSSNILHNLYKKDYFLEENLLPESDLKHIGKIIKNGNSYNKKDITTGHNNFSKCFQGMTESNQKEMMKEINLLKSRFLKKSA